MNQDQIIAELWRLERAPEIHRKDTQSFVSLRDHDVSITEIRRILAGNEDLCDQLAERIPLDWVFTHDGDRVDIFPGEGEFSREIEEIASQVWPNAEVVLRECMADLAERKLPTVTNPFDVDEPIERIVDTLEGLSVVIERTLDKRLRERRPPLCIWQQRETDKIYAQWDDVSEKFELVPFVLRQALRFGQFRPDAATIVSSTIATLLANGVIPLPGFTSESMNGRQILRAREDA